MKGRDIYYYERWHFEKHYLIVTYSSSFLWKSLVALRHYYNHNNKNTTKEITLRFRVHWWKIKKIFQEWKYVDHILKLKTLRENRGKQHVKCFSLLLGTFDKKQMN